MMLEGKDEDYIAMKHAQNEANGYWLENERLKAELTAAIDEAERLRVQLSDMTGCACDAESLCKYHAMTTASGRSVVLRKQAEAVERLASHYSIKSMSGNYIWKEAAIEEATRLRDQADSLDKGE